VRHSGIRTQYTFNYFTKLSLWATTTGIKEKYRPSYTEMGIAEMDWSKIQQQLEQIYFTNSAKP
jgi:hypothetical protein